MRRARPPDQFPGARIELVDSLTATAGLGLQALHAGELARDGATPTRSSRASGRPGASAWLRVRPRPQHLARTGRIGKARAALGGLLKIVPVLRLDRGEVEEQARVRTFARAQDEIIASTLRETATYRAARIQVMHSHAPELAGVLLERLRERSDARRTRSGWPMRGP